MQDNEAAEITWKNLFRANQATPVPFLLTLGEHPRPIECQRIVRIVPKKRLVIFGRWNDQPIVAKLFFHPRRAKHHIEREIVGIETLREWGVPSPKLLLQSTAHKKRVQVLVFEQITHARNLEEIWQAKHSVEELHLLMHAVAIELATQHVLGIVQRDLHFKNLLVKGNVIYTLDGGSIESVQQPLPKKPSLDHLGLFFAQLGVGTEALQQRLFQAYSEARGWIVKPADLKYLDMAIKKYHQLRRQRYETKLVRSSSLFVRKSRFTALSMYDRRYADDAPDFNRFLTHPDSVFALPNTVILKDGRSSTVAKVVLDHRTFVVKRYNLKNTWHWLRRCMRPSRAVAAWRLANLLRLVGIPTAKPFAFIEKRFLGFRRTSYLLMEYIEGPHLGDYFSKYHLDDPRFVAMAEKVLTLFKNLAKMQMSHGDLKMTNILVKNERPVLLDLDGMKEYRTVKAALRAYHKEIKRFMANWDNQSAVKNLFEQVVTRER